LRKVRAQLQSVAPACLPTGRPLAGFAVAFECVAAGSVSSNRAAFAFVVDANLASAYQVRARKADSGCGQASL